MTAPPFPAHHLALSVHNVSKSFSGRHVLRDVTFGVRVGAIHGLVGGNGSGKSTLIKCLAGVQPADAGDGTITVGSATRPAAAVDPSWSRAQGLRFVHQNPAVFPTLDVAENLAIGEPLPVKLGRVSRPELHTRARKLLNHFGIDVSTTATAGDLRLADQTMIAIARALQDHVTGRAPVSAVILDEPTAALPEEEVSVLLEAVRRVAASGIAVVYVSHRLDEILSLCTDLTVLRNGHHVSTTSTTGLTEQRLIADIVGRPLDEAFPKSPGRIKPGPVVASVRGLRAKGVRDVDLDIRSGEILGIAGLLGSGRSELLQALFGHNPPVAGTITIDDRPVRIATPRHAMNLGIAYIPEHRDSEAAFPDRTVAQNISAVSLGQISTMGRLSARRERSTARESFSRYQIRADDEHTLMSSLSGGNQQKAILARWMRRQPRLLLLDEPTQGIDVGARTDAYTLIRRAVTDGAAAVLVSSDFEELADMSDRVLVLDRGRITAEVSGNDLNRHRLTELVLTTKEISA
ncbi:sugar ABC transporter ATP-binding protein [Mycolicibacterium goodii]|uniref:ABC transporter domain-containing protein n=1 Tax=Mycolicibacterium goodii TaxID=134601 RepID=A0A0K0X8W4_MYCGD|nr:hypothetical protein AFA91_20300 [Mycolicibacterium goodii]